MKILVVGLLALVLFAAGCGVNKDYVTEQIQASEARASAQISGVSDKTDANGVELAKLQQLARDLETKTDLAINKASGFENYQVLWTGEINFAFDSYEVDGIAASIINEAGTKMEQVPGSVLEIVGHTDATGAATYNLMMGEKRAGAVKRHLADNFGISLYRMFILSYGESKPKVMMDEQQAASKNRRASLTIWGALQ
jgi:outer membrane protein OmpA-like peptidoglycan-associated protein